MTAQELFADEITDAIKEMARRRLRYGGNLAPRRCNRPNAKLALLLVLEVNPREALKRSEAALLFGMKEDTFRKISARFRVQVNLVNP